MPTTHPLRAECHDTDYAKTVYDGICYSKGASIIK